MLTLFHAPHSRSTRILTLLDEMGITDRVDLHLVDIRRADGSGARDPANPHPEGKVPALLHDGHLVTESAAVILYLTTLFPGTGLAPEPGDPDWGDYLGWLFWYGNVMEPVLVHAAAGLSHPILTATFRGEAEMTDRVRRALDPAAGKGPWLLGARYSAVDLLVHSPWAWFGNTPDDPATRDWVARCMARPAVARVKAAEALRRPTT